MDVQETPQSRKETYLAVIKNSVGTKMFQRYYLEHSTKRVDVMRKGDLSCGFFVSSILTMFGLIKKIHGTVDGTVKDLEQSEWTKISKPEIGCIIVWGEKKDERGEMHKHIGFYIGNNKAVSNSSKKRTPVVHHWTFGKNKKTTRAIEALYAHHSLK